MLVRSKLWQPATRKPGTTPCNQEKCKTCPFICTNISIQGPKSKFNCQTYKIVHNIHCTKYAKFYIGETGRTLDTRFKEHLADIKHFKQAGHSIHNIRVKGLWLLFTDNASDRKDMEFHLIDKLGSSRPGGINEKLFLFCFTVLSFFFLCNLKKKSLWKRLLQIPLIWSG